ncbi:glycosyltransferase [Flavobacterium sp. RHBU_24]|uniref:glycosyltransferase n=1 Tax=Flavobacterium sp. RHBU_24 TaxID=3391185 RepID=UPI003984801F
MHFSLIIPVYNRPDEIEELLQSLTLQDYNKPYEIVIIEDGSTIPCREVAANYSAQLTISYYFKPNSGPGDSRNYGMQVATGDYFIILDSDCIIPPHYLSGVEAQLANGYVDCFGGSDAALSSFSPVQKAINFAMTSFMTTGGIRGKSEKVSKFQPRSFNMGISKEAFESSGGFGDIHPGEDPDLSIRLWKMGFKTKLFSNCFVYHKRRIDWEKFNRQVTKFGKARPILDKWHPEYKKITFLFPTLFMLGMLLSFILAFSGFWYLLYFYILYFLLVLLISGLQSGVVVGFLSVMAVFIQFYGYGSGYFESFVRIHIFRQKPKIAFPELFFK